MKTKIERPMQDWWKDSYLSGGNDEYLENLYETYLQTPDEIAPEWQAFFKQLNQTAQPVSHQAVRDYFSQLARQPSAAASMQNIDLHQMQQQEKVIELIDAYRSHGHLLAKIDPLELYQGFSNPTLELSYYGFSETDLSKMFDVGTFAALNKSSASLREIYEGLRKTYCGTLGIEYMHIEDQAEVAWIQNCIEQQASLFKPSADEKRHILAELVAADGLEKYIGSKYVGQKRFSLEGGDSLIPLLDTIVNHAAGTGVKRNCHWNGASRPLKCAGKYIR